MTQAATAVEPRFRISQFNSELDNQPRHREVTLDGVFRLMTNFRTRKHKKPAPCWSPAEYHADETRGAPGVKQVNVLVYDIDSGVTPAELQLLLGDLRYCLATTFSSTEEHWKLRLAIGLKTPIPAGHFDQVWVRGQMSLVNGNADEAAKDCSRIYFNASHPPGVTPFSVIHDGRLLDWRLLPSVRAASAHAAGSTGVSELPIGTRTLDFIANGAPDGEQRERAVAAARSLLSSGCSVEQTAGLLWQGFQQSPQRAQDPWLEADALKIAESIAASAPPPLRPQVPVAQTQREQAAAKLIADLSRPRNALPIHWTTQTLMDTVIDPPREIVAGLLYEGLGVFAARPKFGKSWIAFDMSIAVAQGTLALHGIPCAAGDVLYCALEDGPSRLQTRLRELIDDGPVPTRLEFRTKLDRLDEGGLVDVAEWLQAHPTAALVIIDTWKRVQPRLKRGQDMDLYGAEYDAANTLKSLADRHHVAILLIHHTRKPFKGGSVQDFLDEVLGTSGLTGAADSITVARRERNSNEAVLYGTGRDFPESSRALTWNEDTHWTIGGDAEEARQKSERHALVSALEADGGWVTPTELSMILEKGLSAAKMLAWRAGRDGVIQGDGEGRYAALGVPLPEHVAPSRARARGGNFVLPSDRGDLAADSEIRNTPLATVTIPNVTGVTGVTGVTVAEPPEDTPPESHPVTPVTPVTLANTGDVTEVDPSQNDVISTTVTPVTSLPPARTSARVRKEPEWTTDDKGRAKL